MDKVMRQKSLSTRLLLTLAGVLTLGGSVAVWGFWLCWSSIQVFQREVDTRMRTSAGHRNAVRVQDSGAGMEKRAAARADTESREKHWAGFQAAESGVQKQAASLHEYIREPKPRELVEKFLAAHRAAGEAYRAGYKAYTDGNFDSKIADKLVKGIDRAPAELLTQAAEALAGIAADFGRRAVDDARRAILVSLATLGGATRVVLPAVRMADADARRAAGPAPGPGPGTACRGRSVPAGRVFNE